MPTADRPPARSGTETRIIEPPARSRDDALPRQPPRAVRDRIRHRRRRHGRGVQGARHPPRPLGRDQDPPSGDRHRSRSPREVRARGQSARAHRAPEHPRHPRCRSGVGGVPVGHRDLLRRDGVAHRRHAPRTAGARAPLLAEGGGDRRSGGRRPRGGARPGDRAPRPEAREPVPDLGRAGEDPGLRSGVDRAVARFCRRDRRVARRRHGARDGPRHARLHVARAGAGDRGGRPGGFVRAGVRALRDGDRAPGVRAADGNRDAGRNPRGARTRGFRHRDGCAARPGPHRRAMRGEAARGAVPVGRRPGVRAARAC